METFRSLSLTELVPVAALTAIFAACSSTRNASSSGGVGGTDGGSTGAGGNVAGAAGGGTGGSPDIGGGSGVGGSVGAAGFTGAAGAPGVGGSAATGMAGSGNRDALGACSIGARVFADDFNRGTGPLGSSQTPGNLWQATTGNPSLSNDELTASGTGFHYALTNTNASIGYFARLRMKFRLTDATNRINVQWNHQPMGRSEGIGAVIYGPAIGNDVGGIESLTFRSAQSANLVVGADYYIEMVCRGDEYELLLSDQGYDGPATVTLSDPDLVGDQTGDLLRVLFSTEAPAVATIDEIFIDEVVCPPGNASLGAACTDSSECSGFIAGDTSCVGGLCCSKSLVACTRDDECCTGFCGRGGELRCL